MNEKPGCPGTAAKLPYSPGNQKLTPPSSAHELFVDNKTEITNRNALNKSRTLDAMNSMRLIEVKTCDAQIPDPMRSSLFATSRGIAVRERYAAARLPCRLAVPRCKSLGSTHSPADHPV